MTVKFGLDIHVCDKAEMEGCMLELNKNEMKKQNLKYKICFAAKEEGSERIEIKNKKRKPAMCFLKMDEFNLKSGNTGDSIEGIIFYKIKCNTLIINQQKWKNETHSNNNKHRDSQDTYVLKDNQSIIECKMIHQSQIGTINVINNHYFLVSDLLQTAHKQINNNDCILIQAKINIPVNS